MSLYKKRRCFRGKILISFLFVFLCSLNSYGQKGKDSSSFISLFKPVKLPLIIDYYSYQESLQDEISYSELSENIRYQEYGDLAIEVDDTIVNRFYAYGKYHIDDNTALILRHEQNTVKSSVFFYLLLYSVDNEFLNLENLSEKWENENLAASLIYPKYRFMFKRTDRDSTLYFKYDKDLETLFYLSECDSFCKNYVPEINSLSSRNYKKIYFNKSFFEQPKVLIPLEYGSPNTSSVILSSIGRSKKLLVKKYFIDSRILSDGKVFILFLNEYTFAEFKKVSEVGYMILNTDTSIYKKEQISLYMLDKNDLVSITETEVNFTKDKIIIRGKNMNTSFQIN